MASVSSPWINLDIQTLTGAYDSANNILLEASIFSQGRRIILNM